jgi:protein arginine kinase activator
MLCEICHQKPATVKLTQIVNGQKKEMNLCKSCADKKGLANPFGGLPDIVGSIILGILSQGLAEHKETKTDTSTVCDSCGLSIGQFEKTGILGCSNCYQAFKEPLKNLLRRIHGSNKHIGSRPVMYRHHVEHPDPESLKRELQKAIENEEYERAAILRDTMRDLGSQIRQQGNNSVK